MNVECERCGGTGECFTMCDVCNGTGESRWGNLGSIVVQLAEGKVNYLLVAPIVKGPGK